MIERILQKLYDEYYPDRDIQVLIVHGRVTLAINDTAQASYSIKGTYRYEEVQKLNQFTNGFVQYGFCPGDGPTAIIGLTDPNANLKFILDASPYGKMPNTHRMIFNRYSDEDAKQVSNYTVYGLNGLLELADIVKFDKIHFSYDARYQEAVISQEPRVLKMNCKFDRFHYSYRECKYFATHQPYFEISNSVAFATLEDGRHIALPGFSYDRKDEALGFRDVWEFYCEEPPVLGINFMTDKEASQYDDFEIYIYDYSYLCDPSLVPRLAKVDRTFSSGFDFCNTTDGKDLRITGNF